MKVTMLGCGSSIGVPSLYSGWGACDPSEPRNHRRRCSILVEQYDRVILVDASPDVREQLLDARVDRIDALLITHFHADHTPWPRRSAPHSMAYGRADPNPDRCADICGPPASF